MKTVDIHAAKTNLSSLGGSCDNFERRFAKTK